MARKVEKGGNKMDRVERLRDTLRGEDKRRHLGADENGTKRSGIRPAPSESATINVHVISSHIGIRYFLRLEHCGMRSEREGLEGAKTLIATLGPNLER